MRRIILTGVLVLWMAALAGAQTTMPGVKGLGAGVVCNTNTQIAAPAAPTTGTTSGADTGSPTCTGVTCTVALVAVDYAGGVTTEGTTGTQVVAAGNRLTVTTPAAPTGAQGFDVYVATSSSVRLQDPTLCAATVTDQAGTKHCAPSSTWTESATAGLKAATAPSATNTTGKSSTEVLPANGARASFTLTNDSNTGSVRFGFLASGLATLDDTNSAILLTGGSYSNSTPNGYIGRVVCQAITAAASTIHRTEISVQ